MGDFETFNLPGIKVLSLPSDCGNFVLMEEAVRQAFKPGTGQASGGRPDEAGSRWW